MTASTTMHIGELAERTGLSHRTLRHYDEIGLLTPSARTEGGFRLYTTADEARLLLIRRMKPLGYSLDEMADVLAVAAALEADPADAENRRRFDALRDEAHARREKLRQQVAAADEFIERLERQSTAASDATP